MATRRAKRASGLAVVTVAALAASAVLLSSCSKEASAPAPAPQAATAPAAPKAAKPKDQALPQVPPENAIAMYDEKSFDPKIMRDPFKPFIRLEEKPKEKPKPVVVVPKTPLQRFTLEELKFTSVVWSRTRTPEALIEDPQGKGYKVGIGAFMGNRGAKIVKIMPESLVVEERVVDVLGEENINLITILLHKPDSEVNP